MRLIDADELEYVKFHSVTDWTPTEETSYQRGWNDAIDAIMRNAPTVDVVSLEDYRSMEQTVNKLTKAIADAEPKHGHWITWFENKDVRQAKCSECGMMFTLGKGRDIHYCGNCGAKMDEVLNVPLRNGKSMMELERLMDEVTTDGE